MLKVQINIFDNIRSVHGLLFVLASHMQYTYNVVPCGVPELPGDPLQCLTLSLPIFWLPAPGFWGVKI